MPEQPEPLEWSIPRAAPKAVPPPETLLTIEVEPAAPAPTEAQDEKKETE